MALPFIGNKTERRRRGSTRFQAAAHVYPYRILRIRSSILSSEGDLSRNQAVRDGLAPGRRGGKETPSMGNGRTVALAVRARRLAPAPSGGIMTMRAASLQAEHASTPGNLRRMASTAAWKLATALRLLSLSAVSR
jgi:hypothetical protein